jgi:phage/plasmid-like protein (TIGR03299 family)
MAHNIEAVDGEYAFALRGEPAWHGLGQVFDKDAQITTAEMLKMAKLNDWNVRLEPVNIPEGYNRNTDHQYVVRDNPSQDGTKDILAVVGERYKVYQNEELFAFGDNILDGGAQWESAGSIKNGRQVFGSLVVPREFTLDPKGANDTTKTYLLVHTSHDGSAAIQAAITPVRVVCQNTLNVALQGKKQSFKIRHTKTASGRVEDARLALALTFNYMDEFEQEAKSLFETAIDDKKFYDIITAIYPKPASTEGKKSSGLTVWENKIDLLNDLYFTSPTNDNIKGTAWGAFNALTERVDYFRQTRRGSTEASTAAASGFDSQVNAEKNRIFQAVKALA